MARYNTIWAGPDSENMPAKVEGIAAADLTPGLLCTYDGTGKLALAAANTATAVFVVQDNYLLMKSVDTDIKSGETAMGLVLLDEQFINLRFASGINVAKGAAIAIGANGAPVLATAGSRIVAYADESYNNTSGATQLVRCRAMSGYRLAA